MNLDLPIVGPQDRVSFLALDEPGDRLAAIDGEGNVCVWRLSDAELLGGFSAGSSAAPLAWADDLFVGGVAYDLTGRVTRRVEPEVLSVRVRGERIYFLHRTTLTIRRASTLETITTLGPWDQVRDFDVSPDGSWILLARHDASTLLIALGSSATTELPISSALAVGVEVAVIAHHSGSMMIRRDGERRPVPYFDAAAVGPSGAFLCAHGSQVSIHDWSGPELETRYRDDVRAMAFGSRLYTSGGTAWVAERQRSTGAIRRVFGAGGGGKVISLAFDPAGERLAVGEYEGRLSVWTLAGQRIGLLDGTTLQPEGTIRGVGEVGGIESLAFPGALVACGSRAMRWDGELSGIGTTEPRCFGERVSLISRNGRFAASGGDWGSDVVVFDQDGERFRAPPLGSVDRIVDLFDDGSLLHGNVSDEATELSVFAGDGKRRAALRIEAKVATARFTSKGDVVGWPQGKGPFFRWRVATGVVERWCKPPPHWRWSLRELARGGGKVALWGGEQIVLLDEESGARLGLVPATMRYGPTAVAISGDGTKLAVGSWRGPTYVYSIAERTPRCILVLCTTQEGGSWAKTASGFRHERGEAARRQWSEP